MHSHPKAPDMATERRWVIGRQRRRMLEGDWRVDLNERIRRLAGPVKSSIWGDGDTAKNVFRSIVHQLSTLYNSPAQVNQEDPAAVEYMTEALQAAGYWELMQGSSPLVIGQREGLTRAEVVDRNGTPALLIRTAPADLVSVEADPDDPDVPVVVREYRVRSTDKGPQWVADVFSVADPASPYFRTEDEDGQPIDVGIPSIEGDAYRARWSYADGTPFIPVEWVHAQRTGKLADPKFGTELVDGALTVAAYWTLFGHILRDCSHPQRYSVGVRLAGLGSNEGEGTTYIETDPSSLLQFEAEPGVPYTVGQFAPGGDPVDIGNAIRAYSGDLATDFDISPSDIQRSTGDARSGFAIFLTKEGQRHAQRRYQPSFSRHDRSMIGKIAAMLNRSAGQSLPEAGWDVLYHGLPLGLEERKQLIEEMESRIALGLASKVDVLAQLEGISLAAARKRLEQISIDARLNP